MIILILSDIQFILLIKRIDYIYTYMFIFIDYYKRSFNWKNYAKCLCNQDTRFFFHQY